MAAKIGGECFTVEYLQEHYTLTELTKIMRYSVINDVEVMSKNDMVRILALDKDSNELSYFHTIPKGFSTSLTHHYNSLDFDCSCTKEECDTTTISKTMLKALNRIRVDYDNPISVEKGYMCQAVGDSKHFVYHTKGTALILSSSDNEKLYDVIDQGAFSHFSLGICDKFIYLSMDIKKDEHGNISSVGHRYDLKSRETK